MNILGINYDISCEDNSYGINYFQLKAEKEKSDVTSTLRGLGKLQLYITETFGLFAYLLFFSISLTFKLLRLFCFILLIFLSACCRKIKLSSHIGWLKGLLLSRENSFCVLMLQI